MTACRLFRAKILLVTLIATTLILSAFSHRSGQDGFANANSVLTTGSIDVEAYRLPDGTLPTFCLNDGTDDGNQQGLDQCEFCTLAHGVCIPADLLLALQDAKQLGRTLPLKPRVFAKPMFIAGTPSTGPPSTS